MHCAMSDPWKKMAMENVISGYIANGSCECGQQQKLLLHIIMEHIEINSCKQPKKSNGKRTAQLHPHTLSYSIRSMEYSTAQARCEIASNKVFCATKSDMQCRFPPTLRYNRQSLFGKSQLTQFRHAKDQTIHAIK